MKLHLCAGLLTAATAAAQDQPPPSGEAIPNDLPGICQAYASGDGPGFAVLVTRNGTALHRDAYGYADLESREALTPEHLFYVASVAKSCISRHLRPLATARGEKRRLEYARQRRIRE